ncbi:hypothetical protein CHS0354_040434 [Potamilus streckersoni]|uniref:Uncharacterized protein n=1 Tax=Potamilus streckersoni TaxID=2493646 RepID=A0AAE0T0Y3_9BIVA|nr:hypothetical protein CHS0354_040434 [Potamilus streckersoni]
MQLLLFDNMANKGDMLFGTFIVILQCLSFVMFALRFHQLLDPPECAKIFLPNTACTGSCIDRRVYHMVCISPLCNVVAILLTVQSLYRKEGYSTKVATSWIGISTFLAGLSCFAYICLRSIIRWKLSMNGCEHPNDNFLDVLFIVAVGTVCHIISTLLFAVWRIINRRNSSFLHSKSRGYNNGKSLLISVWTVSNYENIGNTLNYLVRK